MQTSTFENSAKVRTRYWRGSREPKDYGYDAPSPYLMLWDALLQSTISQAGSFILEGKYHRHQCAIYKAEGGCRIEGHPDLVLGRDSCYFDTYAESNAKLSKKLGKLSDLITHIVLNWNPNDPIESMLSLAADKTDGDVEKLREAIRESSSSRHVFGGNSLSSFWGMGCFDDRVVDRDYERFCNVSFNNMTDADVDQMFADRDLGKSLLEELKKASSSVSSQYYPAPMCCSPRRDDEGLHFWVNTGINSQIDGWKTEKELREYIKNPTPIERQPRS
jgi:hypothetical protein